MYVYHMFLGLWSEIWLFHKLIYDIAQGSILIGSDVEVRLRWRVFRSKTNKKTRQNCVFLAFLRS